MTDFIIAKGDLLPSISATLIDDFDTPANLTGCTVEFIMSTVNDFATPMLDATAVVVNAATGAVRYDWTGTDTSVTGNYVARWRVTNTSSGKKMTFPNIGFISITISDNYL